MKAIQVHQTGGPEVLKLGDIETPVASSNQVLIRNEFCGINFIDIYFRTGLYPAPKPLIPGREGSGIVESIGPDVKGLKKGDRVAYMSQTGTYAEYSIAPESNIFKLPSDVPSDQAAAILLQGLTALYLVRYCHPIKKGETVLIHAAAGGVGVVLCQICRDSGLTIIGTVSSAEKAKIARSAGADHVIVYSQQNGQPAMDLVIKGVKEYTGGRGVDVVYDGVGKDTFEADLECLATFGSLISFGNSSGKVPPFDNHVLTPKCLRFMRPTLFTYLADKKISAELSRELFDLLSKKKISQMIYKTYALAEAGQAHSDLEGRLTTGKLLLKI